MNIFDGQGVKDVELNCWERSIAASAANPIDIPSFPLHLLDWFLSHPLSQLRFIFSQTIL